MDELRQEFFNCQSFVLRGVEGLTEALFQVCDWKIVEGFPVPSFE